ncbi:MAG: type II secretion system protein GspL, partial [Candidatus Sedimenticola endophacoides]
MQAVDKIWVRPSEEDKATYQWCLSHAEGHWEEGKGTFDLLAAKLGRERRVRLVAPALDVTLHQVNLPHRNKSVLSKALPFALEDWLAEDLNNLHICVLNREPPDLVTAAVIKRSLMSQWLSDAEAAGLDVIQIVPELFLVPCSEGDLSLVVDKTQCIVRTSRWSGFSLDMNEGGLFQKQLQSLVDEADGRLIQWLSKDCGDIGLPLDLE